jgi:hypothetical protein
VARLQGEEKDDHDAESVDSRAPWRDAAPFRDDGYSFFFREPRGDLTTNIFGSSSPLQQRATTLEYMVDCQLVAASEVGAQGLRGNPNGNQKELIDVRAGKIGNCRCPSATSERLSDH